MPASYLESRDGEDEQIMETFGDGQGKVLMKYNNISLSNTE